MKKPVFLFVVAFLVFSPFLCFSQNRSASNSDATNENSSVRVVPLPNGYLNIRLGMTFESTKSALLLYPVFGFRGDRDVSILPGFDRLLIETVGDGYLDRCWFQFYENKLYTISININTKQMDYYSVFKTLCQKYGSPKSFSPDKAVWEDENVIMSLEKPLCIKYSDVKILNEIENRSFIEESTAEKLRQDFLDSL